MVCHPIKEALRYDDFNDIFILTNSTYISKIIVAEFGKTVAILEDFPLFLSRQIYFISGRAPFITLKTIEKAFITYDEFPNNVLLSSAPGFKIEPLYDFNIFFLREDSLFCINALAIFFY